MFIPRTPIGAAVMAFVMVMAAFSCAEIAYCLRIIKRDNAPLSRFSSARPDEPRITRLPALIQVHGRDKIGDPKSMEEGSNGRVSHGFNAASAAPGY